MKSISQFVFRQILMSTVFLSAGCGLKLNPEKENLTQTQDSQSLGAMKVDVNAYATNNLVCDPFDDGSGSGQIDYEKGVKAQLFYREDTMPRFYKATDYITFARKSEKTVFLKDINVPTRMFSEGFATPDGDVLKKDSGEKLIEYFGLKMTTNIVLSADDEDGDYELAVLADDGANLIIKSGDGLTADETLINNDGDHPTKMGCARKTVRLRKGVLLPVEVQYYQGPRYHISNVLIWRKSKTAGSDPLCGQLGNSLYFDPNKASTPQQAFKDLQSRGWKVLTADNYLVSKNKQDYNPCVEGTKPIITGFSVYEVFTTFADFSWQTNIPATSQVEFKNVATGVVTTTSTDNQVRLDHQVRIDGLQPGATYTVKAISVSEDLGRSSSDEITITMPTN